MDGASAIQCFPEGRGEIDKLKLGVVERREHQEQRRATKRGLRAARRLIIRCACSSCLGVEENTN